jgi:hypothetical protein
MTSRRARAKAAAIPMNNTLPPYLFNLGFFAIALGFAALAVFGY